MGDLVIEAQRNRSAAFEDEEYQKYLLSESEEELLKKEYLTRDDINRLRTCPDCYLCSRSANIYGIEFIRYSVRDFESGNKLFELKTKDGEQEKNSTLKNQWMPKSTCQKLRHSEQEEVENIYNKNLKSNGKSSISKNRSPLPFEKLEGERNLNSEVNLFSITQDNQSQGLDYFPDNIECQFISDRHISYKLTADILQVPTIGATVEFKIGNQEIKNLRMVELHFFKDKLIKTFYFDFGFCIPNSVNSWEHIYQMPKLPSEMIREIINSPYGTRSETFYFVDKKLVIHNKANYAYKKGSKAEWD